MAPPAAPAPASYISGLAGFPAIVNGRVDIEQFLCAATDLVGVVDKISKAFAPVKYDMQGNIEKIRKCYEVKKNTVSCLLELMDGEINAGEHAACEGVLWLNRALLFIELVFQQIVGCLHNHDYNCSMRKIFTVAYEGSVKRYHNWVSQQLFSLICRISPSLPQILKTFNADNDLYAFQNDLQTFNVTIHLVRSKIDDFFKDRNLYQD